MLLALRFSLIDLLHDRSRTPLSLLGLAVVVFSFVILAALAEVYSSQLKINALSQNLVVLRANIFDPAENNLDPQVIEAAQALGDTQISRIVPVVFRHTRLNDQVVQLRSADIQHWQPVFHLQLIKGNWPAAPDELILGEGLAQINHLEIGSSVEVFGREFILSGIYRAPGSNFASVWLPIEAAWDLFGTERGYQALFLQVAAGADLITVKERLQNDPRLVNDYAVYLEDNYTRQNFDRMKYFGDIMKIASLLALLGIVFGVSNLVSLSIVERSRDLGILKGMGFSARALTNIISARFLILSLVAYAFGAGSAMIYTVAQQAFAPFYVLELPLVWKITPGILLAGLIWVLVLTLVGTWLSTRNISRQRVAELLQIK